MNSSLSGFFLILPAFLAGVLVLTTHIPLGIQVLRRGIVFIDLAIAQIAALGVIIASLAGLEAQGWGMQGAAAAAALSGALLLTWMEKHWPDIQEAQIGMLFVLAATASLLLVAHHPHGGEHFQNLLAGQILWVRYPQLLIPAIASVVIVAMLKFTPIRLQRLMFYLAFALAITTSVQLVGIYLVFASLIIPALAVRHYTGNKQLGLALIVGITGYAAGLILSLYYDLPAGPLVVWCLAVISIAVRALGLIKPADSAALTETINPAESDLPAAFTELVEVTKAVNYPESAVFPERITATARVAHDEHDKHP